jgi:hypothetical protein
MRSTRAAEVRHGAGAVVCATLAACAPGPSFVELPRSPEQRSALLVVDGREAHAIDATTASFRLDVAPTTDVRALVFDEPLDALGLAPGPVALVGAGQGRLLPPARAALRLDVDDNDVGRWVDVVVPSGLRFEPNTAARCARFDLTRAVNEGFPVPGVLPQRNVSVLSLERDRRALVTLPGIPAYVVSVEASETAPFPIEARALAADDRGRFVMLRGGAYRAPNTDLLSGKLPSEELLGPPIGFFNELRALALTSGRSSDAIAAVDAEGAVHIGGLGRAPTIARPTAPRVDVAALAFDGETALVVFRGDEERVHVVTGASVAVEVPGHAVLSLLHVPDLGFVAGLGLGEALVRRDGAWVPLDLRGGYSIHDLAPYEQGGFLALVSSGALVQYIPGLGACPPIQFATVMDWGRAARVGRDIAVASWGIRSQPGDLPLDLRYLKRID